MNKIFAFLCIVSLCVLLASDPAKVFPAINAGAEKALSLSLKMIAIYAVWLGLLNILSDLKADKKIARLMRKPLKFLFGETEEETKNMLSMNLSANLLGMGGAATPMGIAAMQRISKEENSDYKMTMAFVLNAACLQIIPTSVISLRAAAGSAWAADIILPAFLSGLFSTLLSITAVKIIFHLKKKFKRRKDR